MTPDPALDAVIRDARHLLFSFDGPIRSTETGAPPDSNAPTAPYIHEALVACNESGRTASAISTKPPIDIPAYLDAHDLFTQITVIAVSVPDAISFLKATPDRCLLVTSSTDDIKAAQAARAPSIGYARTPDDATRLVEAGAIAFVYSMADVVRWLRAYPVSQDC